MPDEYDLDHLDEKEKALIRLALVDADLARWFVHDGQLSERPLDRPELAAGQVWRHKRETWRRVEIEDTRERLDGGTDVYVRRNTSRRTQAIREATLRRDYYYVGTAT